MADFKALCKKYDASKVLFNSKTFPVVEKYFFEAKPLVGEDEGEAVESVRVLDQHKFYTILEDFNPNWSQRVSLVNILTPLNPIFRGMSFERPLKR